MSATEPAIASATSANSTPRSSEVVRAMSASIVATSRWTVATKRSTVARGTSSAPPAATRSSAGRSSAHAASKRANSAAISAVSGTNSGRAGSPRRSVATTSSNAPISRPIRPRAAAEPGVAALGFLREVGEAVDAHPQAARVVDRRRAAFEAPRHEQRRPDRRQRDGEREDLDDDELGAELARPWHGASCLS